MKKTLKILFPIILVAIIAIAFISSKNSEPEYEEAIQFNAVEIAKVFDENELKFENEYIGKRFYFTGKVETIYDGGIFLNCYNNELPCKKYRVTLPIGEIDKEVAAELTVGQNIMVEGTLADGSYVSLEQWMSSGSLYSGDIELTDVVFRET